MDKITHKVRCEQWTNIIKECLASGMPKTTWCREHGISEKSFFYWQRILREEAYLTTLENTLTPVVKENTAPTTTDFIEIKMTDHASIPASPFKPGCYLSEEVLFQLKYQIQQRKIFSKRLEVFSMLNDAVGFEKIFIAHGIHRLTTWD